MDSVTSNTKKQSQCGKQSEKEADDWSDCNDETVTLDCSRRNSNDDYRKLYIALLVKENKNRDERLLASEKTTRTLLFENEELREQVTKQQEVIQLFKEKCWKLEENERQINREIEKLNEFMYAPEQHKGTVDKFFKFVHSETSSFRSFRRQSQVFVTNYFAAIFSKSPESAEALVDQAFDVVFREFTSAEANFSCLAQICKSILKAEEKQKKDTIFAQKLLKRTEVAVNEALESENQNHYQSKRIVLFLCSLCLGNSIFVPLVQKTLNFLLYGTWIVGETKENHRCAEKDANLAATICNSVAFYGLVLHSEIGLDSYFLQIVRYLQSIAANCTEETKKHIETVVKRFDEKKA